MITEKERRHWNRIDTDFYRLIFTFFVVAISLIFSVCFGVVWVHGQISEKTIKLKEAQVINTELKKLWSEGEKLGIELVKKQDMERIKLTYEEEERELQKKAIIDAETKIAKRLVPVGTYIYLKDICKAVQVKSYYGYQANTHEDINFMVTDTDNYYTLSYREYDLCKRSEKWVLERESR